MKIFILVIVAISFFLVPSLVRKWRNIPVLIAVAIASAVNTNYNLAYDYPVPIGPFTFGVDALVGFMFIYTLVVVTIDNNAKHGYDLTISSIAAIILAGIIETCAKTAANGGFTYQTIYPFLFNLVSAFACLVGGFIAVFLTDILRKNGKNEYVCIAVACLAGAIVHYIIFSLGLMISKENVLADKERYNAFVFGGLIESLILIPLGILNYLFCAKVLKIKKVNQSEQ